MLSVWKSESAIEKFESLCENISTDVLVVGGAGAGKTFIMVQRIVNQLVAGVYEPEDIVAITFTNKAAREIRERLSAAFDDESIATIQ